MKPSPPGVPRNVSAASQERRAAPQRYHSVALLFLTRAAAEPRQFKQSVNIGIYSNTLLGIRYPFELDFFLKWQPYCKHDILKADYYGVVWSIKQHKVNSVSVITLSHRCGDPMSGFFFCPFATHTMPPYHSKSIIAQGIIICLPFLFICPK